MIALEPPSASCNRQNVRSLFDEDLELLLAETPIPEARRRAINRRLAAVAESHPDAAKAALSDFSLDDTDDSWRYASLIEALALETTTLWPLLSAELARVRKVFKTNRPPPKAGPVLSSFEFLEQNPTYRDAALSLQCHGLVADAWWIRVAAIKALYGWTVGEHREVCDVLVARLNDRSSQVRREAEWLLADEGLLPEDYRGPFRDWLWARARSPLFSRLAVLLVLGVVGVWASCGQGSGV